MTGSNSNSDKSTQRNVQTSLKSGFVSFLFFLIFLLPIPKNISIPSNSNLPSPHVLAYYTGDEASLASLKNYSSYLDMLSIDVFNVQDDGTIARGDDLGAADYAVQHDIRVYACVSNYRGEPLWDFDPELAREAIQTHKDTFIDQLLNLARDERYTGVNIDLESIAFSDDIAARPRRFHHLYRRTGRQAARTGQTTGHQRARQISRLARRRLGLSL